MVDDGMVDGGSIDVRTWDSVKRGSIEVHVETSGRLSCKELKGDACNIQTLILLISEMGGGGPRKAPNNKESL